MIRRPPRSTLSSSSAASDVYKRQASGGGRSRTSLHRTLTRTKCSYGCSAGGLCGTRNQMAAQLHDCNFTIAIARNGLRAFESVSYTHLRAHETPEHLVCRLLLEKKKKIPEQINHTNNYYIANKE
eukprot:TRINITY_DN19643_c0_g1_i2.p1 TRINITY_DN19643_c0_g1~~TRINITY_DN19643_c0_g1_i2.p1  ORF type:complete len:126 (+),score=16.64 TRINITY_DN19643_c0_g1_i2:132-509(+)